MLKRIKMIEVIIFIYLHNSQDGGKWEGKLQSKHTLDSHTHTSPVCRVSTTGWECVCVCVFGVRVASISHVKSSFASSHNLPHVACFSKQHSAPHNTPSPRHSISRQWPLKPPTAHFLLSPTAAPSPPPLSLSFRF